MNDVVIVAGFRTAVGKFGGSLSKVSASDMGAHVIKGLLSHTGIEPDMVDEVIMGQALTAACGQNPARQAALKAGLPESALAFVVGKVCGSGLKSVHLAAQAIQCGDADIVIAGGQENMSAAPHALLAREGLRMGDGKLTDTMIVDGLWDVYNDYHMGVTAENVAQKYGISRQMQDEFAVASQQKAEAAQLAGKFRTEILPFDIPQKKGHLRFESDEFIKPGTTLATLSGLRPAFLPQGCVTAGNASGLNDGAAAVLMMSAARAAALGFTPMARIQACAAAGVSPTLMGIGPVPASRKCLSKAGWKAQDLDLMEINEAFAAQAMAVNKEMDWDTSKINVNGGSIAIGHPIGASGCRILVTLLHEMVRRNSKRGLASLCIGGGMGIALALARD